MTHERLLEAYRTDREIIANNVRIKKLLHLAIVSLIILAVILLTFYFCATKALHPALKITQSLLLVSSLILFIFAIVLFFIRRFFNDKLACCVYDAHTEIYDRSLLLLCDAIGEVSSKEDEETVLNLAYQKYIRNYLLDVFTDNGEMAYPEYQMVEDYANYLYNMHNWDLSCIFRKFREEIYS